MDGAARCTVFLSARAEGQWGADKAFAARTTDGGVSWRLLSWIVPPGDPYRAVMPSTARVSPTRLVSALRRRSMGTDRCWIEAYRSEDGGASWLFLSRVGDTGRGNGNPPALVRLDDGRLCCVYGQRTERRIIARYSAGEGRTWSAAHVLRDDYASVQDDADLGYPRLVQRTDGCLVAAYYWATRERPQQHIAATIWNPRMEGRV
jgi:hypothetical protein